MTTEMIETRASRLKANQNFKVITHNNYKSDIKRTNKNNQVSSNSFIFFFS